MNLPIAIWMLGTGTEIIKAFPVLWSFVGLIIASGVFWVASRRIFVMQGQANENLVTTLNRHNAALEKERDDYRDKLHAERGAHQAATLENAELKQRPNLSSITDLLKGQSEVMHQVGASLTSHVSADATIFKHISDSLERVPVALEKISARFDERHEILLEKLNKVPSKRRL